MTPTEVEFIVLLRDRIRFPKDTFASFTPSCAGLKVAKSALGQLFTEKTAPILHQHLTGHLALRGH